MADRRRAGADPRAAVATRPPSRWRRAASGRCRPSSSCATCGSTGSSRARPRSCTCSSPARPSTSTSRRPVTWRRRTPTWRTRRGRRPARAASTPSGCPSSSSGKGAVPDVVRRVRAAGPAPAVRRAVVARLARQTFYGMSRWQAKMEHQQALPGPGRRHRRRAVRDGGGVRPGRDAARRRPEGAAGRRTQLADAFCGQARLRVEVLFDELWTNTDDADRGWPRRCWPATSPGSRRACSTRARAPGRGSPRGNRAPSTQESVWRAVR